MLKKRIITSLLVLIPVLAVIFFLPNWVFCAVAALLIGLALYEFYAMVERKVKVYKYFGTLLGILVPVFTYLEYDMKTEGMVPFSLVMFAVFVFSRQFMKKENHDILASTAITLFGILYISWFFSFIIKLKFMSNGTNLVLFLLILTEGGDMGAYFIGSAIGRNLLIPHISPKKTVEGTIGGFLATVILALACRNLVPGLLYWEVLLAGVLVGTITPIGDLAESLFKRDCDVKDSGSLLPGLGGVLDMIDSLLLTSPVLYFYLTSFCNIR